MHIDIVIFNRYNHAVTCATRHFISLISIRKKYESNFKEISKLHLLVVIYECTNGQRKQINMTLSSVTLNFVPGVMSANEILSSNVVVCMTNHG